jgi:hypothetical protein
VLLGSHSKGEKVMWHRSPSFPGGKGADDAEVKNTRDEGLQLQAGIVELPNQGARTTVQRKD